MTSNPPFKKGDLLCLSGAGVYNGRHVHYAENPPVNRGRWCNGWRPWGVEGTVELRHATAEDIAHELRLEVEALNRITDRINRLNKIQSEFKDKNESY